MGGVVDARALALAKHASTATPLLTSSLCLRDHPATCRTQSTKSRLKA